MGRGLPSFQNCFRVYSFFHVISFGKNGKNCIDVLENVDYNLVMFLRCFKMLTTFDLVTSLLQI